MSVYIREQVQVSDMEGPCSIGFHVPLAQEWQNVYDAGVSLSARSSGNGAGLKTYLHLPLAGYRNPNSGSQTVNQGSNGFYWNADVTVSNQSYSFYFGDYTVNPKYPRVRCNGFPIRPFKDTPATPDSSWTALKTGTGSAGIYYKSSEGLISISSNGTTWYTISDKNLGATSVYNNGDTLSASNCGKYYQRGNNYGFPRTGSVTEVTGRIDASSYGPGNYYSSSSFRNGDYWDSSLNTNLRGGTSQGSGTEEISVDIKNAYIGEYVPNQGPCAEGFHVPTHDEWVGLKSIMESLSLSTSTGYSIYLHIPKCGQRKFTDGTVSNSGEARYSCCDGEILSDSSKYINGGLVIYSSTISTSVAPSVAGLSIRPFKNDTIVPDSSWTTIYQGTGSAGIFWNTSEGIISLSSDGTNWITIADKNCGATNVYNNGDTMSESNCGKFYQRGNNYGFPFTGSITTSSTQVDDSNYGPGNYYSSSNFITVSAAPYRWGTSDNLNLRGGEDV